MNVPAAQPSSLRDPHHYLYITSGLTFGIVYHPPAFLTSRQILVPIRFASEWRRFRRE
jgi:hypothetical protein